MTTTPTYVPPGAGARLTMIDGDHIAKAAVADAVGSFELFEVEAPAAPPAPPHVSPWSGVVYLLEGRVSVQVADRSYDLEPGAVATMPAGVPCTFTVLGDAARFLAITTGDGAGRFFADFARTVPAQRPLEETMADIIAVTRRHGVSVGGA